MLLSKNLSLKKIVLQTTTKKKLCPFKGVTIEKQNKKTNQNSEYIVVVVAILMFIIYRAGERERKIFFYGIDKPPKYVSFFLLFSVQIFKFSNLKIDFSILSFVSKQKFC